MLDYDWDVVIIGISRFYGIIVFLYQIDRILVLDTNDAILFRFYQRCLEIGGLLGDTPDAALMTLFLFTQFPFGFKNF